MYCPQCGGSNEESARFCSTCGLDMEEYRKQWQQPAPPPAGQQAAPPPGNAYQQPYAQQPYGPPPYQQQYQPPYQPAPYQPTPPYGTMPRVPSYMGWAIAVLILCFWPTGIVAVVYASQVGNKLAVGDYAGAVHSSRRAKLWSWISFGIAIAWIIIVIIVLIVAAAASVTTIY
ncbi:MAG: CD225/dispanin family protein [Actinobacteria bacterium]|nr:CD225/dispanin family protein [Actinomycetota bacterium]